eukprot:CAMPEP_0197740208 /NCGR_PEP_ID=MMETSP1435-20131217/23019_1 /TAXON_ID=426625 /ORGANISM="Chaetoceros brevis, Strain CCMP164" /LENGTH=81 /DNA_ID=CAMNT_0043329807 /DNA_START=160 /DNA_END=401 /DNA_ORIENTATION=+
MKIWSGKNLAACFILRDDIDGRNTITHAIAISKSLSSSHRHMHRPFHDIIVCGGMWAICTSSYVRKMMGQIFATVFLSTAG